MKIKIICVGKLKEKYWQDAAGEYTKRLSAYTNIEIIELKEYKQRGEGRAAEDQVIEEEGRRIMSALESCGGESFVVALEVNGDRLSSEDLSKKINALSTEGKSEIVFIIGGSLGLSDVVVGRSDFRLSFSDMTFPHQMIRVILLEQIYRSFKIMRGETYHK